MNRTLNESVRSMLSDTNLPKKFWAEALATAVYLRNRSPTRAVERRTPFEAWTKEKPDVSHLKALIVYVMLMFLKTSDRSLMLKQESASC